MLRGRDCIDVRHGKSHHHHKSHHKSRSRSRRREQQEAERELHATWHGRQGGSVSSPVKSSTMPTMSPVSHHHNPTVSLTSSSTGDRQHKFSEIDLSAAPSHSMRPTISKEVSPVRSYSKPEQSLDYRPRKTTKPSSSSQLTEARPANSHKELEINSSERRRSHSVSSPVEKGYYNGANGDRPPDERMESHYIGMGRSLDVEYGNLGPLPGQRGPSKYNETTSSNDTVFYDRDMLLSDLYVREKEIKYSDSSRTKRTRTKSESRGISEENSPTRINENDQIVNLLKGHRRPLEVDAKEFRVLKEKLLREQCMDSAHKPQREVKKVNHEQSDPRLKINVECELKFGDKVNGRLPSDFKDDEVFWGEPANNHKEIVLDPPSPTSHEEGGKLKSSRKSRRENYEIENFDHKHKPSENSTSHKSKASIEKHVSSKEYETRMRDSLPLHYSREEKEWLKEKLLEEFERQEKLEVGSANTLTDKLSVETTGKENPINCLSPPLAAGQSRKKGGGASQAALSPASLSPPCTCGVEVSQVGEMTDTMLEHSYPGPGARSTSAKTGLDSKDRDRVTSKMRSSSHTRHLAISPSAPSRHTPARESGKPATIPRESDQAKSRLSCDSSLPRSPPPYVHPKDHKDDHGCDCHYTSQENLHGHINGGFHRNGSVHGDRAQAEGPFHIDHRDGAAHSHSLEHTYKDHLPLYPDMDNTRGKVNIVIFSGGIKLRRQHWCFLALVLVVLIICLGVLLPNTTLTANLTKEEQKNLVAQILTEVPLIDGHNDLPWNIRQFIHNKLDKVNLSTNIQFSTPWSTSKWSHTDLYRMRAGMVGAQLWTAYAPCGSQHKDAVQITLEQIDLIKRLVDLYPDYLQLATTAQELVDAHKNGKIASVITVESGHSIGTSLGVLRTFQRLGVRALTLTHNCDTPWADCSNADKPGAVPQHNGLTDFGKTVVQEMNKLGIMVDLSHTSVQTARDALSVSQSPVIFSHSSAYAICNASRNVPDDLLRIVAEKRGLVMVNFFSYFLTCSNHSTLNDVVNHINHIRNVAGIDSVGIGASYDGINEVPVGLPDVGHYPELFIALLDSGTWDVEDLKKLAGLNFLRVLMEVEQVAKTLNQGV